MPKRYGWLCAWVLVSLAVLAFGTARLQARPTAAQRCATLQVRAAGAKARAKLRCVNLSADLVAQCLQRAEQRFNTIYARSETPGACMMNGNAGPVEALVDQFVSDAVQALAPPLNAGRPAQTCAAAKMRAAGRKAVAKLRCTNPGCVFLAESLFQNAFATAEAPGACVVNGDAAAIEALVDGFVNAVMQTAGLPLIPTPTPILPPTPTVPPVPTPAPATLCCDGSPTGCFDSVTSMADLRCNFVFSATPSPPGFHCKGSDPPMCQLANRFFGVRCCQLVLGVAGNVCYDYGNPATDATCTGSGGTVNTFAPCGPVSGICGGDPP